VVLIVYEHHAYYTVNSVIIVDRIINKLNNNLFKIINYSRCYYPAVTALCVQKKQSGGWPFARKEKDDTKGTHKSGGKRPRGNLSQRVGYGG
jgi:hypothetical protein